MNLKGFKFASLFALAAIVSLTVNASSAVAGWMELGNSGWTVTWSSHLDGPGTPQVALSVDYEDSNVVVIEKFAAWGPESKSPFGFFLDPIVLTFQQTRPNAVSTIIINDEQLINQTGYDWIGFKWTILNGTTGTLADTQFNASATGIGTPGGFSIDPFTTFAYSQNNQILEVGGGVIPSSPPFGPNVWFPGAASGALVIHAAPTSNGSMKSFSLKEQPIIIPLPAAAWTGLSGLLGLGFFGYAKNLRRLIA
jgi:hypothetical protein